MAKKFKEIWQDYIKQEKKRLETCKNKLAYWKYQTDISIQIEVDQNALEEEERLYGKKK